MINCSKMYHIQDSLDPTDCYCHEGISKRGCPGCCVDCKDKCTDTEEPNKCTTPDGGE